MRNLDICMVTSFYPPYHFGGDAMVVYRLSQALAERGHRVHVVHSIDAYRLLSERSRFDAFATHPNVSTHALTSRRPLLKSLLSHQFGRPMLYSLQLREILGERRYDVIHYHNVSLMGGPGVFRIGQALKLYTTHEYWSVCPTHVLFAFNDRACTERRCLSCTLHYRRPPQLWRYTGLLERCLADVDALLVPSHFAMEQHRLAGVHRPMIHHPHFVEDFVDPDAPSGGRTNEPYFLYVGRLEKLKGVQDLIELFRTYRKAKLWIVGTGNYESELRRQSNDLDHVQFLGARHPSAIAPLYREATAVLVPSLCYETFGLIAAESLAQATPVIARRIGALSEIIEQTGAGYSFETMAECLEAMERLSNDVNHRDRLGRRGRLAAGRLWSVETHLNRYLEIVEELTLGRGLAEGPHVAS